MLAVTREAYGEQDINADDETGIAIPAALGMLGLAFIGCMPILAGLPPLSGFLAKFALLAASLGPAGTSGSGSVPSFSWAFLVVLILSGLATLVAMTRAGVRAFWAAPDRAVPRVRVIEMVPVAALLILCAAQTVEAGTVMDFMHAAAGSLHAPQDYIRSVLVPAAGAIGRQGGGAMTRLLPYPIAAAGLLILWLLLTQALSRGQLLLGILAALGGVWMLSALHPPRARIRRPMMLFRLLFLVLVDIIRSNIAVACIILGFGRLNRRSGFVNIPLDLRDPYGLAMLACIITSTPGTLWVSFDAVSGMLMIHVLDLVDESEWVRTIKDRYERRLMEAFE